MPAGQSAQPHQRPGSRALQWWFQAPPRGLLGSGELTKRLQLAILVAMLGLTAVAGVAEPSDRWRMEGSANAFRDGKSIEFGLITPGLFQFQSGSRHHRSIFVTAGLHSLANP